MYASGDQHWGDSAASTVWLALTALFSVVFLLCCSYQAHLLKWRATAAVFVSAALVALAVPPASGGASELGKQALTSATSFTMVCALAMFAHHAQAVEHAPAATPPHSEQAARLLVVAGVGDSCDRLTTL